MDGGGHSRGIRLGVIHAPRQPVDDLDLDRILRAGIGAGGFETFCQAAVAHIAFPDDAALWIELRHGIGAVPDAVLAADAGVGGVEHDAGDGILGVGVDRATFMQSAERQ